MIEYTIKDYTDGKIWQHMPMGKINAQISDALSKLPKGKNEIGLLTSYSVDNEFNIEIIKDRKDIMVFTEVFCK